MNVLPRIRSEEPLLMERDGLFNSEVPGSVFVLGGGTSEVDLCGFKARRESLRGSSAG